MNGFSSHSRADGRLVRVPRKDASLVRQRHQDVHDRLPQLAAGPPPTASLKSVSPVRQSRRRRRTRRRRPSGRCRERLDPQAAGLDRAGRDLDASTARRARRCPRHGRHGRGSGAGASARAGGARRPRGAARAARRCRRRPPVPSLLAARRYAFESQEGWRLRSTSMPKIVRNRRALVCSVRRERRVGASRGDRASVRIAI